jgi:glutaredoxin
MMIPEDVRGVRLGAAIPYAGEVHAMPVKLHRCSGMWVKIEAHPCWRVQKALDDTGVDYVVVKHPTFPRSKRTEYIQLTGQSLFPAIELEDGTVIRRESKELAEMIRSGQLGPEAPPPSGSASIVPESPTGAPEGPPGTPESAPGPAESAPEPRESAPEPGTPPPPPETPPSTA